MCPWYWNIPNSPNSEQASFMERVQLTLEKIQFYFLAAKMAHVVEIKLGFMDWFFLNLVILIKQCKIPYKNVGKALLFLRNQVFYLKNWKLWQAPTTIDFNNLLWNCAHVSYLPMSTKGCSGFFLFCLELELFAKIKKDLVSLHSLRPGYQQIKI